MLVHTLTIADPPLVSAFPSVDAPSHPAPVIVQPLPLPNQPIEAVADVSAPLADQSVPSPKVTSASATPPPPPASTPGRAAQDQLMVVMKEIEFLRYIPMHHRSGAQLLG
jgi:hypothetical protein